MLGGLWPFPAGSVARPLAVGRDGVFFVPQRPYIIPGSLREQLIYPDVPELQVLSDTELVALLRKVELGHLLDRHVRRGKSAGAAAVPTGDGAACGCGRSRSRCSHRRCSRAVRLARSDAPVATVARRFRRLCTHNPAPLRLHRRIPPRRSTLIHPQLDKLAVNPSEASLLRDAPGETRARRSRGESGSSSPASSLAGRR